MRLQIFSDVHYEIYPDKIAEFIRNQDASDVDIAILAGDIATPKYIEACLKTFAEMYKRVIYVPGNHDHWRALREDVFGYLDQIASEVPNLTWLNRKMVEIEGRRFLGATLWFPYDPLNAIYEGFYGDFQKIPRYRDWVYKENAEAQDFLKREIKPGDIVITHMAPSTQSILSKYRGRPTNRYYICDMSETILDQKPKYWIHGHIHDSIDYTLGETRVLTNPLGYWPHFNPSYRKLVLEV